MVPSAPTPLRVIIGVTITNFVTYSSWTLLNKKQFSPPMSATFPVLLAAYQMFFVGAVCFAYLVQVGRFRPPSRAIVMRILPLGMVRSSDIGFGNAALRLLSVALQQIIKSTIPVYVCFLSAVVLKKRVPEKVWVTLIPIVGGVVMASWGELSASWIGVIFAVVSCVARAGKAIINDLLLHAKRDDERLDTIQIMMYESPLSGVCLLLVGLFVEWDSVANWASLESRSSIWDLLAYNSLCGGLMLLNQWSYISIIKYTSSVTCQVLMNLKMISLIAVSIFLFDTPLKPIHAFGMIVATAGCTLYAFAKQDEAGGGGGGGGNDDDGGVPLSPTKNSSFHQDKTALQANSSFNREGTEARSRRLDLV